jgi:CheY-like chemotaxis protein
MSSVEKPFVLLVDDNEATCTLITAVLHREFTVEIATDGNEAIEKLHTKHYGAILLDLSMPAADGFSVLEWLRANAPRKLRSVLVVTATLRDKELARARAFDICGIVAKPFDVDALLGAVQDCVSGGNGHPIGKALYSSGPMIMLLADLLRRCQ